MKQSVVRRGFVAGAVAILATPQRWLDHRPFLGHWTALGLMIVLGLALTPTIPAQADRVTERPVSPPGSLMVLDANMAEVFSSEDIADETDVAHLAERSAAQLPYVPDVVLLQEVNNEAAANVARHLGAVSGHRYAVVGSPLGDSSIYIPETETSPRVVRITTIVINLDTMELLDDGDRIEFAVEQQHVAEGFVWVTRDDPYVSVKEIDGGMRASVASVHFVPGPRFEPFEAGLHYKADWIRQVARTLDEAYPNPSVRQVKIMGGDLNVRPCVGNLNLDDHPDCERAPHWQAVTEELNWEWAVPFGVDHIFTDGAISASGADRDFRQLIGTRPERLECIALYDAGRSDEATGGCADVYYSDHHFVWALVGMRPRS